MSRVGKKPIDLPKGVDVTVEGQAVTVRGQKGTLSMALHPTVSLRQEGSTLSVVLAEGSDNGAMWGTTRALMNNLVIGVSKGFERKLQLVGVGYRAQTQANVLNLSLGYSHPINFNIPAGVTIETPTQTEILIKGMDKQRIGEVAAKIRAYRPPEPYKGKGVRYADETIVIKEAKKK